MVEKQLRDMGYNVSEVKGNLAIDFGNYRLKYDPRISIEELSKEAEKEYRMFNPMEYNFIRHGKNQLEAYKIRDNLRKFSDDMKRITIKRDRSKRLMLETLFREKGWMNHADSEQKEKILRAADYKTLYMVAVMIWVCSDCELEDVVNELRARWV